MAKTQTSSTLPPEVYSVSQGILDRPVRAVVEMHNLAWGLGCAQVICGQRSGFFDASGFTSLGPHEITFQAGSGYSTRYRGQVWIDPDIATLNVYATATMPASNTGRVRITIGGAQVVLTTHTAGATTTSTGTLATSSTGTGLVDFQLELDHQTGSSTSCVLDAWGVQGAARTSGLPDPTE